MPISRKIMGVSRGGAAPTGVGAIFGFGYTTTYTAVTNLVSSSGVVSTDTTGVGTARHRLAASSYGS